MGAPGPGRSAYCHSDGRKRYVCKSIELGSIKQKLHFPSYLKHHIFKLKNFSHNTRIFSSMYSIIPTNPIVGVGQKSVKKGLCRIMYGSGNFTYVNLSTLGLKKKGKHHTHTVVLNFFL